MRVKTVCVISDLPGCVPAILKSALWTRAGYILNPACLDDAAPRADALLLMDAQCPDGLPGSVRRLRKAGFTGPIAVVSRQRDFTLMRQLMREQVCDFLIDPPDAQAIRELILRFDRLLRRDGEDGGTPPSSGKDNRVAAVVSAPFPLPPGVLHGICFTPAPGTGVYCFGGSDLETRLTRALEDYNARVGGYCALCLAPSAQAEPEKLLRRAAQAACDRLIYPDRRLFISRAPQPKLIKSFFEALTYALACRDADRFNCLLDEAPASLRAQNASLADVSRLWNSLALLLNDQLDGALSFTRVENLARRFNSLEAVFDALKHAFAPLFGESCPTYAANEHFMCLLRYVRRHSDEPLSLSELAGRYHLNLSYCSELFRRVTGVSFSAYLTRLRMERANLLYQSGVCAGQDIYRLVGYNDAYYFSRCYRKYLETTGIMQAECAMGK